MGEMSKIKVFADSYGVDLACRRSNKLDDAAPTSSLALTRGNG
jgi:hypothetical protein